MLREDLRQERLSREQADANGDLATKERQQLTERVESLEAELRHQEQLAELRRYQALEEERRKWEAREERLVAQLRAAERRAESPYRAARLEGGEERPPLDGEREGDEQPDAVGGRSGEDGQARPRSNTDGRGTPSGADTVGAAQTLTTQLSKALLTQQLPPIPKFSDEDKATDGETFQEWLEQFEMVVEIASWDSRAKLVNLATRLRGQAYSFYRSCTQPQRADYDTLVVELKT